MKSIIFFCGGYRNNLCRLDIIDVTCIEQLFDILLLDIFALKFWRCFPTGNAPAAFVDPAVFIPQQDFPFRAVLR